MSASLALFRAKQAGVAITLDGDKLRLEASSPAPSAVLELLAAHKPEIIALLRRRGLSAKQVDRTGPTSEGYDPCARARTCERDGFEVGPPRSTSVPIPGEAAEIERILAAAERAAPRPDLDPADWAGEYEAPLPPLPDCDDEREHDAWLSGVPAADL